MKTQLSRRNFLASTTASLASLVGCATSNMIAAPIATASPCRAYSGSDLADWETVVGDGVYSAPGEDPVDESDIETIHYSSYSEMRANIKRRRIMAHNITFKRIIEDSAFSFAHTGSVNFRLPYLPNTSNPELNGQTVEGGLFVWDGGGTRLDYGLGFQWVINPWADDYKQMSLWTGDGWTPAGYLEPDMAWHELRIVCNLKSKATAFLIDDNPYLSRFSETPKPNSWGTETAARFQVEIISPYPGESGNGFLHRAEFKDWSWTWESLGCKVFMPLVMR